ncbi:SDR family NAD(P)-dependent oxidoreductase [Egicoccus sp. AB-alg2]|uniref:SDR family NAD(P)-dependent oxidoreductase n=1 Tax=Egicoccus sp. AB-alg2 TaxID=3242693 RepID=UPI00359CFA77
MQQRVAVVTGAGSGIGRALAWRLAGHGFALAVSDVDEAGLKETVARLEPYGPVLAEHLDVRERAAVQAHAQAVEECFGRVDLVVNNAGVALHASVLEQEHEDVRWILDVDFWGVVHGTEAFLPRLLAAGGGHLVNVSSVFGLVGVPKQSAYNAAKFAVRGYTEALQGELALARAPVTAHCVHPGGVRTEIARRARVGVSEDAERTAAVFDRIARTSPDAAARAILRGVRRGRPRILVGTDAHVIDALQRLLGPRAPAVVAAALGRYDTRW